MENELYQFIDLILPVYLLVTGIMYTVYTPDRRSYLLGHNTKLSQSSDKSWDFANKQNGKYRFFVGIILLILSAILRLLGDADIATISSRANIVLIILGFIGVLAIFPIVENKTKEFNIKNEVLSEEDKNRPNYLKTSYDKKKIENSNIDFDDKNSKNNINKSKGNKNKDSKKRRK